MAIILYVAVLLITVMMFGWFAGLSDRKKLIIISLFAAFLFLSDFLKPLLCDPNAFPENYTQQEVYEYHHQQRMKDMKEDPEYWQDKYFGVIPDRLQ
jgi:hypothetical protein